MPTVLTWNEVLQETVAPGGMLAETTNASPAWTRPAAWPLDR